MVTTTVTLSGPLFKIGGDAIHQATVDTVQNIAEDTEMLVVRQLFKPKHGQDEGNLKRMIVGEVGMAIGRGQPGGKHISQQAKAAATRDVRRDNLHAVVYDSGVIYGAWIEGVGSRNKASRFKGYGMFRKANTAMQTAAPRLLQRHISRAIRKTN